MDDRDDSPAARRLLTHLAPDPKDGSVVGFLVTTYDLQPEFFDTDFLPTALGVRAINDRSWNARLKMEHELARAQAATVVMAAARYHGRPRSLRVNVQPVAPRHVGVQHAKIALIEQEHAIRLIVGSANVTDAGYRRNREVVAALKATRREPDHAPLILDALRDMPSRLRERVGAHDDGRRWVGRVIERLEVWKTDATHDPSLRFLWGGGGAPLWEQFLSVWGGTDRIRRMQIVSPFWSDEDGTGPVTQWVRKLRERDLLDRDAEVQLLTPASFDGVHGWRPTLPPSYLSPALRELGVRLTATAVDPKVDERDVDLRGFNATRNLHAKLLVLGNDARDLVYLGSANMSHQGWGFVGDPNIEAGLAIDLRGAARRELSRMLPPITGTPVQLDGDIATGSVAVQEPAADDVPWPAFIESLELEPAGENDRLRLRARIVAGEVRGPWSIAIPDGGVVLRGNEGEPPPTAASLEAEALRRLLQEKEAHVRWWALAEHSDPVGFPINVDGEARDRLPFSTEHRQPGEDALIAYYQARIEFSDLFPAPPGEDEGAEDDPVGGELEPSEVDTSKIQSYQIREFVEALPGVLQDLRNSTCSETAMRLALRGPVSPIALARAVMHAVSDGVRTPVAAAFQIVELRSRLAAARRFEVDERCAAAWHNALDQADAELGNILTRLGEEHPEAVGSNAALQRYADGVRALHDGGST